MPRTAKDKQPINLKWQIIAAQAREEAQHLPLGKERDALLKRASQLDTACQINAWLDQPAG